MKNSISMTSTLRIPGTPNLQIFYFPKVGFEIPWWALAVAYRGHRVQLNEHRLLDQIYFGQNPSSTGIGA